MTVNPRKLFKWLGIALLSPILLFVVLVILLYIPPVQNWLAQRVADYASKQTGMQISVGRISLKFPLDLAVNDFRMLKANDSIPRLNDTIADVKQLVVDVRLWPLLGSQVEIDRLDFHDTKVNTDGLIASARVKGNLRHLHVESHGIDLKQQQLRVNTALLTDARVDVSLSDTVPPDTSQSQTKWKILVDELSLERSALTLHTPRDETTLRAELGDVKAKSGYFDLGTSDYRLQQFELKDGVIGYDNNLEPRRQGFDANHLLLTDVNIGIDSLQYKSTTRSPGDSLKEDSRVDMQLRHCSLSEKSGARIDNLSGHVTIDNGVLKLPALTMRTPHSQLDANVQVDFNNLGESLREGLYADIDGSIGKADIMRFAGDALPRSFTSNWPDHPLTLKGLVRGNMQRMEFNHLRVNLPGTIDLQTTGYIENIAGNRPMKADLKLKGTTGNTSWLTTPYLNTAATGVNIPSGIGVDGHVTIDGGRYGGNLQLTQGGGTMTAQGYFDADKQHYDATVNARQFPLQHFLPTMGLSPFSGKVRLQGTGTDIMSPHTHLTAQADIQQLTYAGQSLAGTKLNTTVSNGLINADIDSRHPLMQGKINLTASTKGGKMAGHIDADLNALDLHKLGMTDTELFTSGHIQADIDTDLKSRYRVDGTISNLYIRQKEGDYRSADIGIHLLSRPDTLNADIRTGDLHLHVAGNEGHERLISKLQHTARAFAEQMQKRTLNQAELFAMLPNLSAEIDARGNNILSHALQNKGITFRDATLRLNASPTTGINGHVAVDSFRTEDILLDTLRLQLLTQDDVLHYAGQVSNNAQNPYYTFRFLFDGEQHEHGMGLNIKLHDAHDKLAARLGMKADMDEGGMRLMLTDLQPVLAYKQFQANEDNYIYLDSGHRLSAQLMLTAPDRTGIHVYTNDDNTDALQDLTVSVQQINLGDVTSSLPFVPDIGGMLNGDFHLIQTNEHMSVSTSMDIASMIYEGTPLGDIGADFVYIPKSDGSHFVDGILMHDGEEVCALNGSYYTEGAGGLDATLGMQRFPLEMLNSFIGDGFVALKGYANGNIKVTGPVNHLDIDGDLHTESAYCTLPTYGIELRFDDKPLHINHSTLQFNDFNLYGYNDEPLVLNGSLDFRQMDNMILSLRMRASNLQLINAKETPRSEAYGKAFVNFFGTIQGRMNHLSMRGRVDLLGSTDMTYVLRDSPLTTDNRLDELVRFVDFADTTAIQPTRADMSGMDMNLTINIDEGAHIKCDLNADHSNYVDLNGGGELRLTSSAAEGMRLTGRYALSEGEMKYSLPIIPLKTFTIKDGSYIEFTGEPSNPTLNITAVEQVTTAVSDGSGGSRAVEFECGVVVTQTLQNMGLEFIIDAPEDMTASNELNTMSKEERGKVAVTMLTTGMYLADGSGSSNVNMSNALGAFLQNEINNITGKALRTIDLQFGVDNTTDASGSLHTDYSFKFAKRFWNNRLKISIGGKVSTGAEVYNQDNSFLDNVSFEYRLSPTSNKYVNLFYDRNSYDWIEGNVGRYGAGFLWKRKVQHFRDIFRFSTDTPPQMPLRQPRDSTTASPVSPADTTTTHHNSQP